MLRTATATYLMVLVSAGPWVCCCTAADPPESPAGGAPGAAGSAKPGPGTCCRHHPPRERPDSAGRPFDGPRSPDGPSCPCWQNPSGVTAALVETSSGGQILRHASPPSTEAVNYLEPPHAPALAADAGLWLCGNTHPFSAPGDILRAFHILRC